MCLQMNMKLCIHRQAKCLQNWGKITKHTKLLYDMGRYEEAMEALNNVSKDANI